MHAGAKLARRTLHGRDEIGAIYMIRTRWLVVLTIATVAVIGGLVYRDETSRSEAALDDLGEQQAVVARAANLALSGIGDRGPKTLVALQRPGNVVLLIRPGELRTLDG